MSRALTRFEMIKAKNRAKKVMKMWGAPLTPRAVGHMAETHCRPCSCWMCRGERDVKPSASTRRRLAAADDSEWMKEVA